MLRNRPVSFGRYQCFLPILFVSQPTFHTILRRHGQGCLFQELTSRGSSPMPDKSPAAFILSSGGVSSTAPCLFAQPLRLKQLFWPFRFP